MSGKLTIEARGQIFEQKVVVPKGEPSNFLTENELKAKFRGLTDAILGEERAAKLADAVLGSLAQGAFAAALGSAALRERVGESLLAFLAACCAKAAGAAPQEHSRRDA